MGGMGKEELRSLLAQCDYSVGMIKELIQFWCWLWYGVIINVDD